MNIQTILVSVLQLTLLAGNELRGEDLVGREIREQRRRVDELIRQKRIEREARELAEPMRRAEAERIAQERAQKIADEKESEANFIGWQETPSGRRPSGIASRTIHGVSNAIRDHLIKLPGASTQGSHGLSLHEGYIRLQMLKQVEMSEAVFQYDIKIISKSAPYEKSRSDLTGASNGTYVDYTVDITLAFRDDLPFNLSEKLKYVITPFWAKEGRFGPDTTIVLNGLTPTKVRTILTVPLATAGHAWGVSSSEFKRTEPVKLSFYAKAIRVTLPDGAPVKKW